MIARQKDCRIPTELVPKCPVCGGEMEVNLRCDGNFVEDGAWERASVRYREFLAENMGRRVVFLELGVGMNTPGIIKFPFWADDRPVAPGVLHLRQSGSGLGAGRDSGLLPVPERGSFPDIGKAVMKAEELP